MITLTNPDEVRAWSRKERAAGRRVAFVPTMGALHEGHLSLVREGKRIAESVVVSIYVNPTQFGPNEDLARYPRDLEGDVAKLSSAGADAVYLPSDEAMYPKGAQTFVTVEGISKPLCGLSRPGHFRGVATVVAKLLVMVEPDVALFGEKDFQQLAVIRTMVRDLSIPVEIVGCPIVRERDGLAMSSRNAYLSKEERAAALSLSRSLEIARAMVSAGEREAAKIVAAVRKEIEGTGLARIDYAEIVDPETLEKKTELSGAALVALAVFFGKTRLIDNALLT
ncbi:MAG TPA: pantoate--beta-alanine ligase [bacterium]|nr:pantoate--beta-alanine ligase [bacterium]